ncbi:MAG TPA: GNAT family N-acetyltransferase [Deinococcales bacterium]|nr:GNAT family N-acetyltransferase [Deinococcales bacterium]
MSQASEGAAVTVRDNPAAHQYEASLDGRVVGMAQYLTSGSTLVFTHTEVNEDLEGRGIASRLVRAALDDVRARGLRAAPLCPYVKAFLERNPEYKDLLPGAARAGGD